MMIKLFMRYVMLSVLCLFTFISCSDENNNDPDADSLNKEIANAHLTEFSGFYFVGSFDGRPSIYRYDRSSDKFKIFWNSNEERVIDLLISPDNSSGYFITKRKQRLKSSQPAIEKGRLYRLDFEVKKVEPISQLEEGIQIIPFWMDNDRFTLVINSIDKTIASYINKNIQVYNRFGKLLSDNTEVYDLTKDGYPITKLPPVRYKSPNEMFLVFEKNDSIIVRQQKSQKEMNTGLSSGKILRIEWAENNKHLIMLMQSKDEEKPADNKAIKTHLAIYDLQQKKVVKKFDTVGYSPFVLIGDFLIFDNGIGKDSYIEIFKLDSLSNFKTIKINGGCGLRNI
ncbi:MAG TPA: hypothetical protein VF870_11840 [Ignavibacteriaceae bacterium]